MTPALLPVWIFIAPLAFFVADWLLASKETSMTSRQSGTPYLQSANIITQ